MWICDYCETENQESATVCACCCHERVAHAKRVPIDKTQSNNQADSQPKPVKKKKTWYISIVAAASVLVICYFNIHVWSQPTCTTPETCSICGKVRAPATGHEWLPATCTEPQRCSTCGETGASSLGHNWKAATYEEPKTCTRCGVQEGNLKGFIGTVDGYYSDEWASMPTFTNWIIHPYVLYQPVENCRNMDFTLSFSYTSGTPFGDWEFFIRDENGKWISVGVCNVQNTEETIHVLFDHPVTVTAVGADRLSNNPCDMYFGYTLSNVQQYIE